MLESGWRGLKRGDITSALNNLAMCYKILAEEHGEDIKKCTKTLHEYGRVLLEWARIERDALAYAMGGFDQGGPEDPEVKIEDGISEALDKNYHALKDGEMDAITKAKEPDEFTKGKELDKFTKAEELDESTKAEELDKFTKGEELDEFILKATSATSSKKKDVTAIVRQGLNIVKAL